MKKVLIIGCSFTAGWYELQTNSKVMEEKVYHDYGWYDELPDGYHYTVYSHPGGGYLNYAELLHRLVEAGELDQDSSCIIQETWEPRICLYETNKYAFNRKEEKIHFHLKHGQKDFIKSLALVEKSSLTSTIEDKFDIELTIPFKNYLTDIGSSVYLNKAVDSSAIAVDHILKHAGIPTYRFCVNEDAVNRKDDCISNLNWPHIKHMKTIDMWNELNKILEHHRVWKKGSKFSNRSAGHLTKHGTMLLGKLVATKLTDFL